MWATLIKYLGYAIKYWPIIQPVLKALREFQKGNKTEAEVKECVGDACTVLEQKEQAKENKPRRGIFGRLRRRR